MPADLVREAIEEFAARHNGADDLADSGLVWDAADEISADVPPEE